MRNTITILLLTLVCSLNAQNTFVPDDNFEQALIDLGYDSGPLDDYVPTANINTITSLDVHGKNIADLTGIEDFTALTNLSCHHNQLSALNISNNTNLRILSCQYNQITSLDISNNLALYNFNCYNNRLSTLSIINNTSLLDLFCGANELTDIDVSNNTALRTLYGQDNQLTDLDVSNNPALQYFKCFDNQLISLNLKNGNNTLISNDNFDMTNNPYLTCIMVDDATWSTANWTNIDATSTFVNSQAECDALLGIDDNNFDEVISIYPNPAKDSFSINHSATAEIKSLKIYNLQGRLIFQTHLINNNIDTDHFETGIYMVKLNLLNGQSVIKKLIVK